MPHCRTIPRGCRQSLEACPPHHFYRIRNSKFPIHLSPSQILYIINQQDQFGMLTSPIIMQWCFIKVVLFWRNWSTKRECFNYSSVCIGLYFILGTRTTHHHQERPSGIFSETQLSSWGKLCIVAATSPEISRVIIWQQLGQKVQMPRMWWLFFALNITLSSPYITHQRVYFCSRVEVGTSYKIISGSFWPYHFYEFW
jgi:hypothetical protein